MRQLKFLWGMAIALLVLLPLVLTSLPSATLAVSPTSARPQEPTPTGKDYAGKSLILMEFGAAKLAGANFQKADLRGAVFNGALLTNANFQDVDFTDGIAYVSDFSAADLRNANFTSTMLLRSIFKGANVTGADFSFAVIDKDQVIELCRSASGVHPVTQVPTRESLGCP